MLFSSILAACEQADPTEPVSLRHDGFELAAYQVPSAGTVNCAPNGGRTKTFPVTVYGLNNVPVENAVVTMTDPGVIGGARCWGYTGANGVLNVTLPADANRFFSVRSEISPDAPALEIYPPAPTQDLMLSWNPTGTRYLPRLVSGRKCDVAADFSWAAFDAAVGDPCRIGSLNSLDVYLQQTTRIINPQLRGLNGEFLTNVIIAATSAAGGQTGSFDATAANAYCTKYKSFINETQCKYPNAHGPAFLQAMTITNNLGQAPTGLAVGAGPIWIEAIAPLNDGTSLFATIENSSDTPYLAMEPGICKVGTRPEATEGGSLDITAVKYGVGLKFVEAGVVPNDPDDTRTAQLVGVPNSLIVKLEIAANASSTGTVTYTLRYKGSNASRSVNFDFAIDMTAGTCSAAPAYGNGLTGTAASGFWCTNNGDGTYTVITQLYNLSDLSSASFSAKTNPASMLSGDQLDAQRSDLTASQQEFDLKDLSCPLQLNTDGKLIGIG